MVCRQRHQRIKEYLDERNLLLKNIINRLCCETIKNFDIELFSLFKERAECENIFILI
jgi:hypothetical protein